MFSRKGISIQSRNYTLPPACTKRVHGALRNASQRFHPSVGRNFSSQKLKLRIVFVWQTQTFGSDVGNLTDLPFD